MNDAERTGGNSSSANDAAMERAEALVERMGERLGRFLSASGYQLRKAAARAREEAEDIWAEAQTIRRKEGA
jgi:hypothetical protein